MINYRGKLVPTRKASEAVGLSEWELRRGYKAGEYPAIPIGRGERSRRLRWNIELLEKAIQEQMEKGRETA